MISGRYVKTFAEASHALPDGMHMNADYPFMLPKIDRIEGDRIFLTGSRGEVASFEIQGKGAREFGFLSQSSTFEKLFHRRPTVFKMQPFKDDNTPVATRAAGQEELSL